MRVQGTQKAQTTALAEVDPDQGKPGPDARIQDFDATVGQLKSLLDNSRVKRRDQVFVMVRWDQEKRDDTNNRNPNGDTVDVPKNRIPDVIRSNIFDRIRDVAPLEVTNKTTWFWSFKANAADVVEAIGTQAVQDDIEEIDSVRIVAIQSAQPIPPPETVPDVIEEEKAGIPIEVKAGVGLAAVAGALWFLKP